MFKDKNLEKAVQYKVGKFNGEELTDEDIMNVEELALNNENFDGKKVGIDISEIGMMKNLKDLSLKGFYISSEIKGLLSRMRNHIFAINVL